MIENKSNDREKVNEIGYGGIKVDTKYIHPFVEATEYIFQQFNLPCSFGEPRLMDSSVKGKDIYSVLGVTGALRGQVYIGFSKYTALDIVSAMMGGMPIHELDAMGQSALAELSNMICGNATTRFSADGFILDITPPSVVIGKDLEISSSKVDFITITLHVAGMDGIELTLGMSE
jgi:chemotaxis protein CheX